MTDLSVACPVLDDIFQKVRHLLIKEATRLEEKHEDEDTVARTAVLMYKARCEQEKAEAQKRLASTHLVQFILPVSGMLSKCTSRLCQHCSSRPLSQKPVTELHKLHPQCLWIPLLDSQRLIPLTYYHPMSEILTIITISLISARRVLSIVLCFVLLLSLLVANCIILLN